MRIDCHAHVIRRDLPMTLRHRQAPEHDSLLEDYLALLDGHAIDGALLTAPSFYGANNALLLDALDREPARLRGTAIVDRDAEPAMLRDLARRGIVGIRLNWLRWPELPDVRGREYQRLFGRVRDLDWHVEIYLEGPRLAHVLPAIRQSGVKVVVDHFGSPDPEKRTQCEGFKALLRAIQAGDTWVKLSAPYRLGDADPREYAAALLREGGAASLLWGSDWPWTQNDRGMTYRRCIDWLGDWVPDATTREIILSETPAKLLGF